MLSDITIVQPGGGQYPLEGGASDQDGCTKVIEKKVRVEALVSVTPRVYIEEPSIDCCDSTSTDSRYIECRFPPSHCTFTVKQDLCLHIPMTFDAEVHIKKTGIICDVKPCYEEVQLVPESPRMHMGPQQSAVMFHGSGARGNRKSHRKYRR